MLFLGNPPWVTNSALGKLDSDNLPIKSNHSGLKGLDALTGKSNFDISEWMIERLLKAIQGTDSEVAMLCKTSVARKIVRAAYDQSLNFGEANLYHFDSKEMFDVSVDACLFRFKGEDKMRDYTCTIYNSLETQSAAKRFGYFKNNFVADIDAYTDALSVEGTSDLRWRSGVKHDCSSVMELSNINETLQNGLSKTVSVEPDYIYPLLKSSDLVKENLLLGRKYVLISQKKIGEDTLVLKSKAPKFWKYLSAHQEKLNDRKSSIYRDKPPFSIFGIGEYSFAPWKVAISGLYKQSKFSLIPPYEGKPVMLDDTCYFIPFDTEQDARKSWHITIHQRYRNL